MVTKAGKGCTVGSKDVAWPETLVYGSRHLYVALG